jgi:hypothetical protein
MEAGGAPAGKGAIMEYIFAILIAIAVGSFTVVCLSWHADEWV